MEDLGSDHPQYVSPSNLRGAVHDFALLHLGVHLFDNWDLEALADAAAARNRWEFLLTAAPLPIRGGTGSEALGTFPADVQGYVVMAAGVSPNAAPGAAAKELIKFLTAPAVLPVIKKKGMERS